MTSDRFARLILGTAQLGQAYGVANFSGAPDAAEGLKILELAYSRGVRTLDTAQLYGEAEERIGEFHAHFPARLFKILTKLRKDVDLTSPSALEASLRRSEERVGTSIDTLFVHDASVVHHWSPAAESAVNSLRKSGRIHHLGISVYTPEEFAAALNIDCFDSIQAPFNLLDQRLLESGLYEAAAAQGREVVLRSIFLQGLLLMDSSKTPPHLVEANPLVERIADISLCLGMTRLALALHFALESCPRAKILVGAETLGQLSEILDEVTMPRDVLKTGAKKLYGLALNGSPLTDPRTWATL